jgi:hypothetical protein
MGNRFFRKTCEADISKKTFVLLEKIWECEVNGTLPYQSKSKEYERLEREGYVFKDISWKGFNDRLGPMKIVGWCLTDWGRYVYCNACGVKK